MGDPASPAPGAAPTGTRRLPAIASIPSSDAAFRRHVETIVGREPFGGTEALEARLRPLYPRTVVRARVLTGERATWYVYRDGRWQPGGQDAWWADPRAGHLEVSAEGWLVRANATARGLLGIGPEEPAERYFTDFVAPGTLADATELFAIIAAGHPLEATIRIRPASGDVTAVELRASRIGDTVAVALRMADDIDLTPGAAGAALPALACHPPDDGVFAQYARLALERMPEATPAELAIRLRRLYPHAHVTQEADGWTARRDAAPSPGTGWWTDGTLPEIRFTDRGLIVDANPPAVALLGGPLVGRHWHELVTPGTTVQVDQVIDMIVASGGGQSRFRMPAADGSFVEFDSWTDVADGILRTVMRPLSSQARTPPVPQD